MINFINDFRSSFPYKSGSIISCILSVLTYSAFSAAESSTRGEGALLLFPFLLIKNGLWFITIVFFFVFNLNALVLALNNQIVERRFNYFSDIGYLISVYTIFNILYDYYLK